MMDLFISGSNASLYDVVMKCHKGQDWVLSHSLTYILTTIYDYIMHNEY